MARREWTDAMGHSGGVVIDGMVTRTRQATGEALLAPARNRRSKVDRITGKPGKRSKARGRRKGPQCVLGSAQIRRVEVPLALE